MQRIPKKFVAQSFTVKSTEVSKLTDDKIISLACPLIIDGDEKKKVNSDQVEVLRNTIREKKGIYNVFLVFKDKQGNMVKGFEVEVKVYVTDKKKQLLLGLLLLLLVAIAVGTGWYYNRSPTVVSGIPSATTEKMSEASLKKYAEKQVDKSNVTIQVFPNISIDSDGKSGNMYIQNIPTNKTAQVATLKDKKTGEILYTSELLKPGYQVSKIFLNKQLSKGHHEGIVTLTFYDLKKEKQVGRVNVSVNISVS